MPNAPARTPSKAIADAGFALAAAESKVSFIYGLISGPVLLGWPPVRSWSCSHRFFGV